MSLFPAWSINAKPNPIVTNPVKLSVITIGKAEGELSVLRLVTVEIK